MDDKTASKLARILRGWRPSATVSEALGKLFAATDVGQRLNDEYQIGLHNTKTADRPKWIADRAAALGFDGNEDMDPQMVDAARVVGLDVEAFWPYFLNKYFEEYSRTGNPGEVVQYFGQASTVIHIPGPDGSSMPVAIAWCTPYGSPKKAKDYFAEAILAMEDEKGAGVSPKTVDDFARIVLMESFALTSTEIAWEFLAEKHPEIPGLDDEMREELYGEEHAREIDRLRQVRNRGWESVTQIVPSLSRFED